MRACREGGVLPVVGVELYYRPNRKVQGQKEWLKSYWHLTVHAKDERGWRSLMALVSESHRTGFYGRACADLDLLERYHDGLICLTGCVGGLLSQSILREDDRAAEAWLRQLKRIFRDDLFVEIMPHDLDEQRVANVEAVRLAAKHGIPVVATTDAHYPTPDWADTQDVLLMIATNQSLKKREKKRDEGEDVYEFTVKTLYHQTAEEIRHNFFTHHPAINSDSVDESLRNTLVAAGRITPFLVDRNEKMPSIVFEGDETNAERLRRLAFEGLERRGYGPTHPDHKEYREAALFELATFEKHGVVDYMCVPLDTEILTRSGWKRHDEIEPGDETLGYNAETGRAEWTPIITRVYKGGEVFEIGSRQWSARVTADHRWLAYSVRDEGGVYSPDPSRAVLVPTSSLNSEHRLCVAPHAEGGSLDLTPDEAALLAWILCDGTLHRPRGPICGASIYQKKHRGQLHIEHLVKDIDYSIYHRRDGLKAYRLAAHEVRRLLARSCIEEVGVVGVVLGLSEAARAEFLNACIIAEGSENHGGVRIAQNEGLVLDAIVLAAHLCGYRTRVRHNKIPGQEHQKMVSIYKKNPRGHRQRSLGEQRVWCPQTSLGTWTMRQGDFVSMTGNCIVWDLVDWARSTRPVPKRKNSKLIYEGLDKKPIMVGPGRGSAAGSVVSWAIGITGLNPKKYRCLFERFLNPDRKGLPDIDLDFPPDRVDEVEDYIKAKYGRGNVVDIIAHSTFGPRAALTDVGRVLNVPYDHVKSATKMIDDLDRRPLETIANEIPQVARLRTEQPYMWKIACTIQGGVARKSEHAGGVLILPQTDGAGNKTTVDDYLPVERTGGMKGKLLSAFGERSGKGNALISDYGYTKVDVLRIAELTKQQRAVDLIFERTGERVDLDALPIHDDPFAADPKVMQGFKDGLLVGIFQLSASAAKITRQIGPDNVLELAAINALKLPGPKKAGSDQRFHRRKQGVDPMALMNTTVPLGVMEPFLDYTFGELVFQEQLIEVVHHLGGLTRAEADIFRKIASKLYRDPVYAREVMGEWEIPIKEGFRRAGLDEETIDIVWLNLLSFTDYSFNLAHAAGYAILAYRDMWLKVYYPREFYAAFLSKGLSQITKKKALQKQEVAREMRSLPRYIAERSYKILPPDIHESGRDYTVVDEGIRLGLQSVKNVGPAVASAIEEHRPFASYQDFDARCPKQPVNITAKGSLVMAGAFDRWGMRNDFTEERIDELERELLGMSLTSAYSIQQYEEYLDFGSKFWTEDEVDAAGEGTRVAVVGEVAGIKEHIDTKGNTMCFVDLVYGPNNYSCTVFAHFYAEFAELLRSRRPILVTGVKNTYKERVSIKVESLPPDANGEQTPPIMDLSVYVDMISGDAQAEAESTIYPEDWIPMDEDQEDRAAAAVGS